MEQLYHKRAKEKEREERKESGPVYWSDYLGGVLAQHEINIGFSKEIQVLNSDVRIVAKRDGATLGTLTLSRGSIDWRPTRKHAGKGSEVQLTWAEFANVMQQAHEEKNSRKRGPREAPKKVAASNAE